MKRKLWSTIPSKSKQLSLTSKQAFSTKNNHNVRNPGHSPKCAEIKPIGGTPPPPFPLSGYWLSNDNTGIGINKQ